MCLKIDDKRTKRVKRTLKDNGGKTIMWKMLVLDTVEGAYGFQDLALITPFQKMIFLPGKNESSRTSEYVDHRSKEICLGIHVYTNKSEALSRLIFDEEIIVPVTVLEEDFIRAGTNHEAVFMKVFLNKEDYGKAIADRLHLFSKKCSTTACE
jgi:hypothetical protein